METVKKAPGFVAADAGSLPKNVTILGSAPDGVYLVLKGIVRTKRAQKNYHTLPKRNIPAGSLIFSTENGHLYQFTDGFQLAGLGKNNSGGRMDAEVSALMVQRVNMEITINDYVEPPKPKKKVAKKKASKKKVSKKR